MGQKLLFCSSFCSDVYLARRYKSIITVDAHILYSVEYRFTLTPCSIWTSHEVPYRPSCPLATFLMLSVCWVSCTPPWLFGRFTLFSLPLFFISFPSLLSLLSLSCTLGVNHNYAHTNMVNLLFSSHILIQLLHKSKLRKKTKQNHKTGSDTFTGSSTGSSTHWADEAALGLVKVLCGQIFVPAFLKACVCEAQERARKSERRRIPRGDESNLQWSTIPVNHWWNAERETCL